MRKGACNSAYNIAAHSIFSNALHGHAHETHVQSAEALVQQYTCTSFTLATRVGSLGSARIGALQSSVTLFTLQRASARYRLFVLVRYCITGYVVY